MTRKDYILLAFALSKTRPIIRTPDDLSLWQWKRDCHAVAKALANDNPRFDHARFFAACGLDEEE